MDDELTDETVKLSRRWQDLDVTDTQWFKYFVNHALDEAAARVGRVLSYIERGQWWLHPQGGVAEPFLLMVRGTPEMREAVIEAAENWECPC